MKQLLLIVLFTVSLGIIGVAQPNKTSARKPTANSVAKSSLDEISNADWSDIVLAFDTEDWEKSVLLINSAFKKLRSENDKKQLARLRYLYIFSLAGKTSQEEMTPAELKLIIQSYLGKEFVSIDRQILTNCDKSLNFICPIKSDTYATRTTATNKSFSIIHSFEYTKLIDPLNFEENKDKYAFVGGVLKQFEVNQAKDRVWIMRLFFSNGWVKIVGK